jgi:hypothetical protein
VIAICLLFVCTIGKIMNFVRFLGRDIYTGVVGVFVAAEVPFPEAFWVVLCK